MRKKILAIVFAALLTLALAVPAFAQDEQGEDAQANAEQGEQANEDTQD